MEKTKPWIKITKLGKFIKSKWKLLAKRNRLKIEIMGLDQIPLFVFKSPNNLKYKTFITQEMLKNNILASNVIYLSISHDKNLLNKYFKILDKIFKKIHFCEKNKLDIDMLLEQEVCISGLEVDSLKLKTLALIPARSGSKGIKNKNIKKLNGKPLINWTIETCLKSNLIDYVVVTSDSQNYLNIAYKNKISQCILRPKKFQVIAPQIYKLLNMQLRV